MSCYIVGPSTINRIVTAIVEDKYRVKDFAKLLQSEPGDDTFAQELADELYQMNVRAYQARYADRHKDAYAGTPEPYKTLHGADRLQLVKTLTCFLYQAGEDDVPDEPLYKAVERYRGLVAYDIVSDMAEYDKKEWD